MALEASEVAVRVRLLGGSAFETEAKGVGDSIEGIGTAGKKADVSGALGKSGKSFDDLGNKVKKFGGSITGMGRALAPTAAAIAGLGYYAVKAQSQFQSSMMLLYSQAGLPRKNLQGLTKDVLSLSHAVGQSPLTLAKGAYNIVSDVSHNPATVAKWLRLSAKMAAVGGDTVDNTSSALSSIWKTGIHPQGGPAQVAAWMESAIGQGKMHMSDITSAMSTSILPMVKMSGMKFPQLLAAIATEAREGVPAGSAASRMRLSLTSVLSPTLAGTGAMQEMGLSQFALAHDLRSKGGLLTMLQDLKQHTAGMGKTQSNDLIAEIFGKSRGIGSIGALLQGLPQMQKIYSKVLGATPQLLDKHFAATKSTSAFKMQQLKAEFDVAMIKLGQVIQKDLLPALVKLMPYLTSAVEWFGKLSPGLKSVIVKVGALIVILAPVLLIFGGLVTVVGTVVGWFGTLWPVIEGLWGVVSGGIIALGEFVGMLLTPVGIMLLIVGLLRNQLWNALVGIAKLIDREFWRALHLVVDVAGKVWGVFKKVVTAVESAIKWFEKLPSIIAHLAGHVAGSALGGLGHDAKKLFSFIPGLASGGFVQSSGLTMVGEMGPELLSLPRGASVTPLPNSGAAMFSTQMGNGAGATNVTVNMVVDSKILATAVENVQRKRQNRK